jgi:hypothetical protein
VDAEEPRRPRSWGGKSITLNSMNSVNWGPSWIGSHGAKASEFSAFFEFIEFRGRPGSRGGQGVGVARPPPGYSEFIEFSDLGAREPREPVSQGF